MNEAGRYLDSVRRRVPGTPSAPRWRGRFSDVEPCPPVALGQSSRPRPRLPGAEPVINAPLTVSPSRARRALARKTPRWRPRRWPGGCAAACHGVPGGGEDHMYLGGEPTVQGSSEPDHREPAAPPVSAPDGRTARHGPTVVIGKTTTP